MGIPNHGMQEDLDRKSKSSSRQANPKLTTQVLYTF